MPESEKDPQNKPENHSNTDLNLVTESLEVASATNTHHPSAIYWHYGVFLVSPAIYGAFLGFAFGPMGIFGGALIGLIMGVVPAGVTAIWSAGWKFQLPPEQSFDHLRWMFKSSIAGWIIMAVWALVILSLIRGLWSSTFGEILAMCLGIGIVGLVTTPVTCMALFAVDDLILRKE